MKNSEKQARRVEKEKDKLFALENKKRDGFKCAICEATENLQTHHILPRENRALRHNHLNAICLCFLHHKFSLEISPHKNAFIFFLWLEKNRPEQFKYLKDWVYNLSNI